MPRRLAPALRVQSGLGLLSEALQYAAQAGCDPWDFAVEIGDLWRAGLASGDLRWTASQGWVACADELTRPQDTARSFRPSKNLRFTARAAFVITESGLRWLKSEVDDDLATVAFSVFRRPPDVDRTARAAPRPHWDAQLRRLLLDAHVVKRFRLPAPNQEIILAAFEEEGWPERIDDPLPPCGDQEPKCRLHDTIKCLNRHQVAHLLQFMGDGTGQGVLWEPVEAAKAMLPRVLAPRSLRRAA
jgi:hypothetical protein